VSKRKSPFEQLFNGALLVFGSIVLIYLALQILASIWYWIVLVVVAVAGIWIAIRVISARRQRW
jgi:hypothetical protein